MLFDLSPSANILLITHDKRKILSKVLTKRSVSACSQDAST